jgi:hypothetical protein
MPPAQAPKNGFGTAALVLGILALLGSFIPIVGIVAIPMAVVGVVLAFLGLGRVRKGLATNKGSAIAGIVLNTIALVVAVLMLVLVGAAVNSIDNAIDEAGKGATGNETSSSADGSGLSAGNWEVQGDVVVKRDFAGDFTANFRVENVSDTSDSALLTVSVLNGDTILGTIDCTTRAIGPGQIGNASCISLDKFSADWSEITLENTF